jgi:hypothetical protein
MHKFGPPLVIFDLVKRKEKRPRETILLNGMTWVECGLWLAIDDDRVMVVELTKYLRAFVCVSCMYVYCLPNTLGNVALLLGI